MSKGKVKRVPKRWADEHRISLDVGSLSIS